MNYYQQLNTNGQLRRNGQIFFFEMYNLLSLKKEERKYEQTWNSYHGSVVTILTSIHEDTGLIPGLAQWVKDPSLP